MPREIEERTRADVERRIQRLREEYGDFQVHEEIVENDPAFFEHGRELAGEGWRGDAGAWVTDDEDRVLLIRHAGSPKKWGIPGGGHEPGESHAETARREVREETGVECEITGVWRVRIKEIVLATDATDSDAANSDAPDPDDADSDDSDSGDSDPDAPDPDDSDRRFWMLTVWFEATAESDQISIADEEILEARWFADPPENSLDFLQPKVREWAGEEGETRENHSSLGS